MRKRVCSLQCNHSLVRAVTPNNYTLPSQLRLCSLFVASYDSQGQRWKYSNLPPHGVNFLWHQGGVYKEFVLAGQTVILLWCFTATARKCVKTAPKFGDKRTGCCITITRRLTLPISLGNFWPKATWLSSTHPTFLCFLIEIKLKGHHFDTIEVTWDRIGGGAEPPSQNTTFRMHLRNGRSAGNDAYVRKGTASRVVVVSRPKVSFLPDDNTSPGNYGWLFVFQCRSFKWT
jgi:hypothetical protein